MLESQLTPTNLEEINLYELVLVPYGKGPDQEVAIYSSDYRSHFTGEFVELVLIGLHDRHNSESCNPG